MRTRIGSPWMPQGKKRRHWAMPELWVTCALGPYNFEFMTRGDQGDRLALYKVDGIFSNRWAGSGMCYCEHCRENFKAASASICRARNDPQDPARPRVHRLAAAAAVRAVALVGWRDPQDQSGGVLHPQCGRGRD